MGKKSAPKSKKAKKENRNSKKPEQPKNDTATNVLQQQENAAEQSASGKLKTQAELFAKYKKDIPKKTNQATQSSESALSVKSNANEVIDGKFEQNPKKPDRKKITTMKAQDVDNAAGQSGLGRKPINELSLKAYIKSKKTDDKKVYNIPKPVEVEFPHVKKGNNKNKKSNKNMKQSGERGGKGSLKKFNQKPDEDLKPAPKDRVKPRHVKLPQIPGDNKLEENQKLDEVPAPIKKENDKTGDEPKEEPVGSADKKIKTDEDLSWTKDEVNAIRKRMRTAALFQQKESILKIHNKLETLIAELNTEELIIAKYILQLLRKECDIMDSFSLYKLLQNRQCYWDWETISCGIPSRTAFQCREYYETVHYPKLFDVPWEK